jgi:hypothetical protein
LMSVEVATQGGEPMGRETTVSGLSDSKDTLVVVESP